MYLARVHACPDIRLAYSTNALAGTPCINKPLIKRLETRSKLTEQDDLSCPFLDMGEPGCTAIRSHTSAFWPKPSMNTEFATYVHCACNIEMCPLHARLVFTSLGLDTVNEGLEE